MRTAIVDEDLPAWARARTQPATYPRAVVEVAAERGADRAAVLGHAGVEAARIEDPAGRLSLAEMWRVHEAVAGALGDTAIGFEVGDRLPLTAHGNLGYALLCAATPREAVGILERFWHLRGRGFVMRPRSEEGGLFLEVAPELPTPARVRDPVLASMLTSIHRGMCFLGLGWSGSTEMWLPGAEPAGFAAIRERLPPVRFEMPAAGMRILADAASLDRRQATANPEGLAHALAACERESALMGGGADPLLVRTRAALQLGAHGYPPPAALARALHVTPRTLRRRLQEHGTSYQALLEEARRRDACRLLERPEVPVREIGALLGYDDPANFTRAFRGWTGVPPTEWRRARGG
jgi:AraC-like DNA-binding protein